MEDELIGENQSTNKLKIFSNPLPVETKRKYEIEEVLEVKEVMFHLVKKVLKEKRKVI